MKFKNKRIVIVVMALFMLFTIFEPLSLNALSETIVSTDDSSESIEQEKQVDDDAEIDAINEELPSDNNDNSISKMKGTRASARIVETDQSWFTFSGNTITGYSSSATAPKDIVIPSTYEKNGTTYEVTAIGNNAFIGQQLNSVILNENLQTIGNSAFANNADIKSIIIPNSVTSIGSSAFSGCTGLTSATLSENLTSIPDGLFNNAQLTSIIIPDNVTAIGSNAFYKNNLSVVKFPSTMKTIGSSAFTQNPFSSISIPEGITSIESYTFFGCSSLTSVTFPNTLKTIGTSAFESCRSLETITLPDAVTTIGSSAFRYGRLKEIKLSSSITTIDSKALTGNTGIKIRFKNKKINEIASAPWDAENAQIYWQSDDSTPFYFKNGIIYGFKPIDHESIPSDITDGNQIANIPTQINGVNVTQIATKAFSYTPLTSVTFPDTLTTIGSSSFSGCKLREVTLGNNVTTVGADAFSSNANLSLVIFGDGIRSIGSGAFSYTKNGIKIKLESKDVNSILGSPWGASNAQIYWKSDDNSCFYFEKSTGTLLGFKPLDHASTSEHSQSNEHTIANIPRQIDGVMIEKIANNAFKDVGITSLTLPDTITTIGESAFSGTKLVNVDIPSSVTSAGKSCFSLIYTLKDVNISGSLRILPQNMFMFSGAGPGTMTVTLNEGIEEIGNSAFYSTDINAIQLPNSLKTLRDNAFYSTDLTSITIPMNVENIGARIFYNCTKLTTVNLPRNMTAIPLEMFSHCTSLKSIVIPNTVTNIAKGAFGYSGLSSIKLPESLNRIGISAFYKTNLKEIKIPDNVTSLSESAFSNCEQLKKVTLPNTLIEIGYSCFEGDTSLTDINLPKSLRSLGSKAFKNCTNITKLDLNEGLESIGANCIEGTNITELELPSTLKTMNTTSLVGYQGSKLLVRQPRASSSIASSQPWGSGVARENIFYQGEYTELEGEVVYSQNYNKATIHLDVSAMTGSIIKTITLPNGTILNNVDTNSHSLTFDVEMNGSYTFSATSNSGDSRSINVTVDRIIYAVLEAQDITITTNEVSTLTTAKIIDKSKAKGTNNSTGTNLNVSVITSLTTIKNILNAPDKSVQVVLSVNVGLPDGSGVTKVEKTINIYTAKEFSVTFLDWDDTVLKSENVFEGDNAIPPSDPIRKGYSFTGWDKSLENISENTIFKAQYSQKKYTVSYDTGGAYPSKLPNKTVTWEEDNLLPSTDISKAYYTFSNWFVPGLRLKITNATKYSDLVEDDDTISEVTMAARWTPIPYTLRFNANGGSGPQKEDITFNIEKNTINIGTHALYKEGCTFEGWNTKADGSGNTIASNSDYTPVLADTTLYAQWKEQGPSYYLAIPKSICLKNEKDSDYASAINSISIVDKAVTEGTMPNKSIEIFSDTLITLTNNENSDTYKVEVFNANGDKYSDSSQPLMKLSNTNENDKTKSFQLRTPKNLKNKLSTYQGIMRFTIRFGG